MKKIKIIYLLLLVPAISLSHNISSNISITKLDDMKLIDGSKLPDEIKNRMRSKVIQMKTMGFIEEDVPYVATLISMKYFNSNNEKYTRLGIDELKNTPKEIKINFPFKSILLNPIAYMGVGILSSDGSWSGIKEFFDGNGAGICTLSIFKIGSEKGTIQINEEEVTYDVNDKPTTMNIRGNKNYGFMYSIEWDDINYSYEVECANKIFNPDIMKKIIKIANQIDIKMGQVSTTDIVR